MYRKILPALTAFVSVTLSVAAPAEQGLRADKLRELQSVGQKVVAYGAADVGLSEKQREAILSEIAVIREHFNRSYLGDTAPMKSLAASAESHEPSIIDEALASGIGLLFDDAHAARYLAARRPLAALEKLDALRDDLDLGSGWWHSTSPSSIDPLKVAQIAALERLIVELGPDLDFRKQLQPEEALRWVKRLTPGPGQYAPSSVSPMIENNLPAQTRVKGK